MALTNVDLDRIDGNSGLLANVSTSALNGGPLAGVRNRIINGDMRIDQRNAGASVTITNVVTNTYTLDRWSVYGSVASKFSVQQNAGSVTPPAGHTSYFGATSLSSYAVGAGEFYYMAQYIEGLNAADLDFGKAGAKTVTLSFWVRSSVTGTFSGALSNSAYNRTYPFTYTISSANTWEQKAITIAGDTSGTWLTTNGIGLSVYLNLGSGSNNLGTAGAWAATGRVGATGSSGIIATNGATFYVTGIQLEAGSVATPFEQRSYGQELALCQRYYHTLGGESVYQYIATGQCYSTTQLNGIVIGFPATMRTSPTFSYSSLTHWTLQNSTGGSLALSTLTQDAPEVSTKSGNLRATVGSGLVAGNAALLYANNTTSARLNWSAEL